MHFAHPAYIQYDFHPGRWTAHNATHLTYEHVQNNGGNVTDTFTIVQHNH